MCGFVAIIDKNQRQVERTILQQMADTIAHRGPDDEGHFLADNIGFYHKRLSIIDIQTGQQPMSSGPFTIVFNGEIYNYIELRKALQTRGHRFKTSSDTEVILKLYDAYGVECVDKLNGMFAFLLYDRNRRQIIAARDHFGIKPLYYYVDEKQILFVSEIKALLHHPEVESMPDFEAIQDYITYQYVMSEKTFFKNIFKVLPGRYQIVELDSLKVQTVKYWKPNFEVDLHHTEEYFIVKLRELLDDTVKIQMRSDVPVGAYLSGGIDSSIVTLLAAQVYGDQIKTFTGAFKEGIDFNETRYAREVIQASQAESFEIYPSEDEFIDLMPKLVYHMDEPCAGPGLFPQYMVSKLASQKVKVVLGGQGGDEIFGGYTRFVVAYFEQALKGAIFRTTEEGEHIVSLKSILPNLTALKGYVPMIQAFWRENLFEPMDQRYFRLIDRSGGELGIFSDDFNRSFDSQAVFRRFQRVFNNQNTKSYYNKMVNFDMVASLPALLHVEDRVSMANSLESRVPLLDRRIVDLVTRMPPAMKFKGAELKYILKKAVKDFMPQTILERTDKMGFPVPLHIWAKHRARDFFKDVLLSNACRQRGLFNISEVEKLIEQENAYGRRLWGLLNIELWFRTFIDNH